MSTPEPAVALSALELVDVADAALVVRLHLGRPEAALTAVRAPHTEGATLTLVVPLLLHVVEELLGEGGLGSEKRGGGQPGLR